MSKEYVIRIAPDNLIRLEELDPENVLEDFQRLCGGFIQTVPARLGDRELILAVDEEGKLKDGEVNVLGTFLTMKSLPGDRIAGPAVLCQVGMRDGEPDLAGFDPEEAADLAEQLVHGFMRFLSTLETMD